MKNNRLKSQKIVRHSKALDEYFLYLTEHGASLKDQLQQVITLDTVLDDQFQQLEKHREFWEDLLENIEQDVNSFGSHLLWLRNNFKEILQPVLEIDSNASEHSQQQAICKVLASKTVNQLVTHVSPLKEYSERLEAYLSILEDLAQRQMRQRILLDTYNQQLGKYQIMLDDRSFPNELDEYVLTPGQAQKYMKSVNTWNELLQLLKTHEAIINNQAYKLIENTNIFKRLKERLNTCIHMLMSKLQLLNGTASTEELA